MFSVTALLLIIRGFPPSALQRWRLATGTFQHATQRLQRGAEDDVAVGKVGRLDVVVRSVGQLPQVGAVGVDLVEVVVLRAAGPVGEQDFAPLVVNLRIANAPARIVEQDPHLAAGQVEPAELAANRVGLFFRVVAVVAEVGVVMDVGAGGPDREDQVVDAFRQGELSGRPGSARRGKTWKCRGSEPERDRERAERFHQG